MYRAGILSAASADIQEAVSWYNEEQPGRRFIRFVRAKVLRILRNPQIYVIRYAEVRTAILAVFPFMIHFKIVENTKTVLILAVLHVGRNPAMWQSRA
ncbi:MAG TPA: type II toxin-antitoxin system RelE/ParE family toxin [Dyadobacter sp.]|jgi:plasmid stabilization system protein ParE|nr:type II toxin-antitoxin system RelE/ParE family toxin [Dyadobacter sp.]